MALMMVISATLRLITGNGNFHNMKFKKTPPFIEGVFFINIALVFVNKARKQNAPLRSLEKRATKKALLYKGSSAERGEGL